MGFDDLALRLPQPSQAYVRAQFPGSGLLFAGNIETLVETGFRFGLIVWRQLQEKLAFEPIQFGLIVPLFNSLDKS